jgi:uncharacterized protein YaiL (DUF2058 family)
MAASEYAICQTMRNYSMGLSLQEQLLKAGLVSKGKANKVKKEKNRKVHQKRKAKGSATSEQDRQAQKARAAQAAKDRELSHKLNEAVSQREIAAQIKQLVENNRHPRSDNEDDIAFYFENKGKIKKMYVSTQTHKMIIAGKVVIINYNGVFELVPANIAEKVRRRNPSLVITLPEDQEPNNDEYAEHQVPDDLMW